MEGGSDRVQFTLRERSPSNSANPPGQRPATGRQGEEALDANFFRVRHDRMTPLQLKYLLAIAELGEGSHPTGRIVDTLGVESMRLAPRG